MPELIPSLDVDAYYTGPIEQKFIAHSTSPPQSITNHVGAKDIDVKRVQKAMIADPVGHHVLGP